ncbi:MAG TPA: TraC family protein [Dissulfurispiraceae bacterium]|nr:TraC family protein [Dissulfurispiraceae bacterium]
MLSKLIEKYYDRPFVTDLLFPVAAEEGIYLLSDGAVGQIWEIRGINCDGKSADGMKKDSNTFANFIRVLPEDVPMQIINVSWQGIDDESLQNYMNGDMGDPYIRQYMERKIAWHNECKHKGFAKEGTTCFYPRTIRTFLTIKQNPLNLSRISLYTRESFAATKQKLKSTTTIVETSLSSAGIGFKKVGVDDLIAVMYRILNPERYLDIPLSRYAGGDIRRYVAFNSAEAQPNGWESGKTRYNVISFANNPSVPDPAPDTDDKAEYFYTVPNILFRELGGTCLYDFMPMMLFTVNFNIPPQAALSTAINMKKSLSFMHKMNFIGEEAIDKKIAVAENNKLLTAMYGGEKAVKASYHLCIPASVEESDFITSRIVSRLNVTSSCNAFQEDLIASGIFMRCLPFGFDHRIPDEGRFVRRAVTATSANLADIAPIYRSGCGVRTDKAIGYWNRRGEPTWFDPFDKDTAITSGHILITGATGAGKSVTAVDFIHQALRQPATVILIDKGESYKRLCLLKKGQYLKFEGETDFKLDPFVGDFSADHRAVLTSAISTMVTGGYENITREEVAAISEAVLQLSKKDRAEKSITDIAAILKESGDPISVSVARKLFPFYGQGQFAGSIEGDKPALQLSNQLTVCELGDVDMHKDYQSVIVSLLIYYITEFVKKIPDRKYLFIDEAWSLFKNEVSVDFLVKAVKTFRKFGVSVVFLTQQLDDFAVIARAINMKDNLPNKILLYQEPDVIVRNAGQLELSQGDLDLYKTIKKGKYYTEALIKAQQWTAVGRISLDPKSYWVATTSDPDKELLKNLMDTNPERKRRASDPKPMTLEEAIQYASEKYPYGVK